MTDEQENAARTKQPQKLECRLSFRDWHTCCAARFSDVDVRTDIHNPADKQGHSLIRVTKDAHAREPLRAGRARWTEKYQRRHSQLIFIDPLRLRSREPRTFLLRPPIRI